MSKLFMKSATVVQCENIGERFRLITLESEQFRGVEWRAGEKLQIVVGGAFTARTYTPLEWDGDSGRTRILGYAHNPGPGSAWLRALQPGDSCEVLGPRASLEIADARSVVTLFGDETSIGLAYAVRRQRAGGATRVLLEVSSREDAVAALSSLQLHDVDCFERSSDDDHLREIERRLAALVDEETPFVLSGRASSIQRLHRSLKGRGVPADRLASKVFWAPGKVGLD